MRPGRGSHPIRALALGAALAALATAVSVAGTGAAERSAPRGGKGARWIERKIERMTLRQKVGQMFVANVYGLSARTSAPPDVIANQAMYGPSVRNARELLARYPLGGLVYFRFANNLATPGQTARLSNGIQRSALSVGAGIPLLIATDQENGLVSRVWPPATQFPGNMALGATRSGMVTRTAYTGTARELKALGINQNYAPVADVNVNPANPVIGVRSFGERPELVSRMTAAGVQGTQRAGLIATVKHFPGHGDTVTDSHTGVPWIFHDRETWERVDAPPFEAGIEAGADMVMTAHVVMPYLQSDCDVTTQDGCDPATLDREILTGLLREQLGFKGVIVTDALNMAGVREKYGDEHIAVLAIKAGVDMPMLIDMPEDTASLEVAFDSVMDAVASGELSESRVDSSVRRILRLKLKRGILADPFVDARKAAGRMGTKRSRTVARWASEDSVTLLRNDAGTLPVKPARAGRVLVTGYSSVGVSTDARPAYHLSGALRSMGYDATLLDTGYAPDANAVATAVQAAAVSETVVLVTSNASGSSTQRALAQALTATGKPVIGVAVRNPFDPAWLPDVPAYLATYSWSEPSMDATARAISGELNPTGKLPVRVPFPEDPNATYMPFGFGMTYPVPTR